MQTQQCALHSQGIRAARRVLCPALAHQVDPLLRETHFGIQAGEALIVALALAVVAGAVGVVFERAAQGEQLEQQHTEAEDVALGAVGGALQLRSLCAGEAANRGRTTKRTLKRAAGTSVENLGLAEITA